VDAPAESEDVTMRTELNSVCVRATAAGRFLKGKNKNPFPKNRLTQKDFFSVYNVGFFVDNRNVLRALFNNAVGC